MRFPITSDAAAFTSALTAADDVFRDGMTFENLATGRVRVSTAAGSHFQNGLKFGNAGRLVYIDATAGLPVGSTYCNGIPLDADGHLCISTGPVATWQNGIPYTSNGAVAAQVTP